MIKLYTLLFTLLFCNWFTILNAQVNSGKYRQAEDLMNDGNFNRALEIYQNLREESPNNANLNFKIGFCFLNTATQKTKAISYLEFASNKISPTYNTANADEENVPLEVLFYLGQAYHVNYRFDDAERVFYDLKKQVAATETEFIKRIDHELAACQYARILMKTPVEMTVSNLGKQINSPYTEHSPVISGDESLLIFTSKRVGNTGGQKTDDGQYFEDIYISKFNGKQFNQAKQISKNINTPGHEASIGLSFDGSKLFIYRDDEGDGNIYVSNRNGDDWDIPEPLPAPINSKYRETHASMSFNGNEIYFTSDRKGGYGGLDIYRVRKLPNGNWSKAQNMGPNINTPYDEEGPYLHPDGTSLFFASKGHNNMGGFDIFVSYNNEAEDTWMKAENIGYPINTPDDDVYYVPSVDGRRAYYASYQNNSIGYYDIFRIDLSEAHVRNQTVISGIAHVRSGDLLENATLTISTMNDDLVGVYTPDQEYRKFLAILPRGKTYKVLFESTNYDQFEKIIKVPEFAYDQSGKVVKFDDIVIGGNEPFSQNALALSQNSVQKNDQGNVAMNNTKSESINSIAGSSQLANAASASRAYEDGLNAAENANGNIDDANTGLNEIDEQQGTIGADVPRSEFADDNENQNKSVGLKNDRFGFGSGISKTRILYYLLGLIAVSFLGYIIIRRK